MRTFEVAHRTFKVNDFLAWQRDGSLRLSPSFQRRPLWKPQAKSYLIDTIVRGLPVPVIFIRERTDLDTQRTIREVVDGQQRLRTIFSYVDPNSLPDFDPERDDFRVLNKHNALIANQIFAKLDEDYQQRILDYEFSTQVLPSRVDDREVLQIFARLNSTGDQLNGQELRNAKYFGAFKTAMYDLALQQLERWRSWNIFTEQQIARMLEVEFTSDATMTMLNGITGKSQPKLDKLYGQYDDHFPVEEEVARRFQAVMDEMDDVFGHAIKKSAFSSEVYFYTLFIFVYDQLFDLRSSLDSRKQKGRPAKDLSRCLEHASKLFRSKDVPDRVLDAFTRASADYGRRQTRHDYLSELCS